MLSALSHLEAVEKLSSFHPLDHPVARMRPLSHRARSTGTYDFAGGFIDIRILFTLNLCTYHPLANVILPRQSLVAAARDALTIIETTSQFMVNHVSSGKTQRARLLQGAVQATVEDLMMAAEAEHRVLQEDSDSDQSWVTRCICGFTHNDDFMVSCDLCDNWQHIDCLEFDPNHVPENYICDHCRPRYAFFAPIILVHQHFNPFQTVERSTSHAASSQEEP